MKRQTTRFVLAGALALLSMALPSCKQGCYECTCHFTGSPDTYEVCRENYETQKQFETALKQFEDGSEVLGDCVCTKE